jgi:hypothetical protein
MNETIMRYPLMLLLAFASAHIQAPSDDDLARMFYPPALSTWVQENPGIAEQQEWSSASADLDHTGTPNYLIVVYSNGHIGRLRVIKKTPSGPVLAADPVAPALYENHPRIQLVDVDHDGKPEIVTTYRIGNHGEGATWIFGWDGSNIRPLNPPDPNNTQNVVAFRTPDFIDLNGDGTLTVVEASENYGVHEEFAAPEDSHPALPDRSCNVYSLVNGRFSSSPLKVMYYGHFARASGQPKPTEESFISAPGNYILRVANGQGDKGLVDSAEVQLNGQVVLAPAAFNNQRSVITVPVTLRNQNTLRVDLRSAPGSQLRILIEPAS